MVPRAPLVVPIGLVDNPFEQRRETLVVDLRGAGGTSRSSVGRESGKTTALRTLVLALAATARPRARAVYGLDFGGGFLSASRLAAACRGHRRQATTGTSCAGSSPTCRRWSASARRSARRRPTHAFLVIDGWAVVRQEFDGLEEAIGAIAAQGLVGRRARRRRRVAVGGHQAGAEGSAGHPASSYGSATRPTPRWTASGPGCSATARPVTESPRDGLEFVVALPHLDGVDPQAGADGVLRAGPRSWRRATPAVRRRPFDCCRRGSPTPMSPRSRRTGWSWVSARTTCGPSPSTSPRTRIC